ncbi:MAG: hypothetical protein HQL69_00260 [Magnetococcales bacterium]|nr:hypothetical protein [Magnetococcales bacterium]
MSKAKLAVCWRCQTPLPSEIGRSTVCSGCQQDVRVCHNCRFYDAHSYNECQESQAERVLDKENATFCDYFSTTSKQGSHSSNKQPSNNISKSEALKAAEALFK